MSSALISVVDFRRHCERSEAISSHRHGTTRAGDCFASLAMTTEIKAELITLWMLPHPHGRARPWHRGSPASSSPCLAGRKNRGKKPKRRAGGLACFVKQIGRAHV